VIPKALWRERAELEFVTFGDYTSSNMSRESFDRKERDQQTLWGAERRARESESVVVQADTLDNIIAEEIGRPVRFVNLTINGAEAEALKGAAHFLAQPEAMVAFPLQELESPLYPLLAEQGMALAVGDAPTKAWEGRQFLYGTAGRLSESRLQELGYSPAWLEPDTTFPNRFHVLDDEGEQVEPTRGNEA
jgi:FkbM family methyltransferase